MPDSPIKAHANQLIYLNGAVYVFGGIIAGTSPLSNPQKKAYKYVVATGKWIRLVDIPNAAWSFNMTHFCGRYILVFHSYRTFNVMLYDTVKD